MELNTRVIKYNSQYYDLTTYNANINELEKGTFFGTITKANEFGTIYPRTYISDNIEMQWWLSRTRESIKDWIPTALLFKKLDDNLAEELLTGEIFVMIEDENVFRNENSLQDIEEFQDNFKKYSDNHAYIALDESPIIVVNDMYKYIFKDTLSRKEEVKKALKEIKQQSKTRFDDSYDSIINDIRVVANTENFLYDVEHKNKTSH